MEKDFHRQEKAKELIREAAATFVSAESNRSSLITVTNVALSDNASKATILVTVLPEHQTKAALDFLNRNRGEMRNYLKKHASLKRLPSVLFEEDFGEKNRQRIDELSEDLPPHQQSE